MRSIYWQGFSEIPGLLWWFLCVGDIILPILKGIWSSQGPEWCADHLWGIAPLCQKDQCRVRTYLPDCSPSRLRSQWVVQVNGIFLECNNITIQRTLTWEDMNIPSPNSSHHNHFQTLQKCLLASVAPYNTAWECLFFSFRTISCFIMYTLCRVNKPISSLVGCPYICDFPLWFNVHAYQVTTKQMILPFKIPSNF